MFLKELECLLLKSVKYLNDRIWVPLIIHFFQKTNKMNKMQGIFFCNSFGYFIKNITKSDYLFYLFPSGFHSFSNTASNFLNIIPIVFRKFSLSLKNYGNFDANELLEVSLTQRTNSSIIIHMNPFSLLGVIEKTSIRKFVLIRNSLIVTR